MESLLYIQDHKKFTESILNEIQKLPFGSLPKTELEMVILHSIICSLEPNDPYSNIYKKYNELKTLLKLNNTQLRNKILASQIRFDKVDDKKVEDYIIDILKKEVEIEGQFVVFSVFNPLLNDTIKSYFETREIISDTSFNKNLIKINLKGLLLFINQLNIDDVKKEKIIILLNKNKNEGKIAIKEQIDETKTIIDWSKILTGVSDLSTIVSNIFQIIN